MPVLSVDIARPESVVVLCPPDTDIKECPPHFEVQLFLRRSEMHPTAGSFSDVKTFLRLPGEEPVFFSSLRNLWATPAKDQGATPAAPVYAAGTSEAIHTPDSRAE